MTDPGTIRKFEYRPSRITTTFKIDFAVGERVFRGVCRDVSVSGIRAVLDGSLTVGSSGQHTLHHPVGVLDLEAQITYIEKENEEEYVGLVFLFRTPWETANSIGYMDSIANYKANAPMVRSR